MKMLQAVMNAVAQAGSSILDVYNSDDFGIEIKEDNSPLTKADQLAHDILVKALSELKVGPILSEEDADISWAERQSWKQYWLVDPLDGTKEFIKRSGEFTVNVALVRDGEPVLGVVYAPVMDLWYVGEQGKGAWKQQGAGERKCIKPAAIPEQGKTWRIVGSRSHSSDDFERFMAVFPNADLLSVGSSLKLCMVADGSADLYPRLIPTCEWDTAAAQAIVEAAGAKVLNWETKEPLRYNTKETLLNPYFVVCSEPSKVWLNLSF
ncbi:3'(2'),5'-bisphosphate nucleotidase CysQ [Agaribacterium sp. ZY112]|uniref:3'(2'),5'-bisphosphate nucleotidase CysQ n=1 Tax=Agaribacterium sp. ZY112 TaxID=3233574 RepID=UPI003523DF8F